LVEPSLASSGLEIWDVEVSRDTVRILVDRPGGVDLDSLARLAGRVVSPLLDEHPELTPAGQFSLEVSSPGVERTLRRPEQYERFTGQEVAVKTKVAVDGARRHQGILVSVDDGGIVVAAPDGPEPHLVSLPYDQIDRARTVLTWGPADKPGAGRTTKGRAPKGSAHKTGAHKAGSPKAGARKSGSTASGPDQVGSETTSEAVKRPAASGHPTAAQPVASREKETE
jgi:ribosome maturation factor RimP